MQDKDCKKILIVDDEPDGVVPIVKFLAHHGMEILVAENGLEGLAVLTNTIPDLILLDLSMPLMSGWEMLEKLRAIPTTIDIPVIAITAHALKIDKERVLEAGFDGYITKPFRPSIVVKEIMDCLSG